MLARKAIEQIRQAIRVLDHREMPTRNLDRIDTEQLARHEALPVRFEELIVGRVHERGRNVRMAGERVLIGRRCHRTQVRRQRLGRLRR